MENKYCPKCGAKVNGDAQFCPKCGYAFNPKKAAAKESAATNETKTRQKQEKSGMSPFQKKLVLWIGGAIVVTIIVVVAMGVITNQQQEAKQQAIQESQARQTSIKKSKEVKEQKLERSLASGSVDIVTDMIQNDMDLDAKCTDVTIESSLGDNQYSGYASVEDDYGNSDTADLTITNVKYDNSISVHMDGDARSDLEATFNYNDDE